jgi:hypothetical protein
MGHESEFEFVQIGDQFTPEREKIGYSFVPISIEGPNGVGKTTLYKATLSIMQAVHAYAYSEESPIPPIIGIAEPPDIQVSPDRKDTWRSLAKSGLSKDGVIPAKDFKNAMFQSELFFWGRRIVEEKLYMRFPTRTSFYRDDNDFV